MHSIAFSYNLTAYIYTTKTMKSSPLSLQFDIERLKRYLKAHPEKASELAINYFEERPRVAVRRKGMREERKKYFFSNWSHALNTWDDICH